MTREQEGGFSLIELLVAMAITLIVSGAIYGLLASGQNAFRREPELTERQQNIRLAMDLIMRDTANAGAGLPPFVQLFSPGLANDASSPAGPSGAQSDEIEMLTGTGQESEPVCAFNNNAGGITVSLARGFVPPIGSNPPRMVFLVFSEDRTTNADDRWTTRRVTAQVPGPFAGGGSCQLGSTHELVTFADGTPGNEATLCEPALSGPASLAGNIVAGSCGSREITRIAFANQVRYRIRTENGVPVLQRSSSEAPGTFETLARGIEEMQVQYTTVGAPTTWVDAPPPVAAPAVPPLDIPGYATLVNQVRVRLTSRSEARNIQGATNNATNADPRLRGSLVSTSAPRATLLQLARNRPPSPLPSPWYWE